MAKEDDDGEIRSRGSLFDVIRIEVVVDVHTEETLIEPTTPTGDDQVEA